jgi:hypothetical protein
MLEANQSWLRKTWMKQTWKDDDVAEFSVPLHHGVFKHGRPTGQRNRGVHDHNTDEGFDGNMTPPPPAPLGVSEWGQQQHQFTSAMTGKKQNLTPIIWTWLHTVFAVAFCSCYHMVNGEDQSILLTTSGLPSQLTIWHHWIWKIRFW